MDYKIVEESYSKEKVKMTRKIYKTKINDSSIIIILLALLFLLFIFSFNWGFGYMGGMMFFGPIFMVLVLLLIVWLIVSLTQRE